MNRRKQELSVLNVLFCLMVIMIHILSYPVTGYEPGSLKYNFFILPWRMITFVVQGFIFLAGVKLFLTKKDEVSYGLYLKKRFKAILLPYVFCSVFYCIFYIFNYKYTITLDYYLTHLISGNLCAHFYFVPLLVQFDLLLPLWKRIVNKYSPLLVIPVFFIASTYFEIHMQSIVNIILKDSVNIFNDRLFTTYMSYWIIGCYAGKYYDEFCSILKKNFRFICMVFGIMFALCVSASIAVYNGIAAIPNYSTILYLYFICAIIFLFAVSLKLPENITDRIPLFKFIDSQSYDIYLWHMLVLLTADIFVRELGLVMQSLAFMFRVSFVYIFTVLFVMILKKLREKINPTPIPVIKFVKQKRFKVKYNKKAGR